MRMLKLLTCVSVLAAAPAYSAPPIVNQIAPSDADQVAALSGGGKVVAPEEKKICRQLPSSNSRLPNRACLTQKQWQQIEDDMSH